MEEKLLVEFKCDGGTVVDGIVCYSLKEAIEVVVDIYGEDYIEYTEDIKIRRIKDVGEEIVVFGDDMTNSVTLNSMVDNSNLPFIAYTTT